MSKIEDIMYEAHRLGVVKEIHSIFKELKSLDENKYTSLSDLYEKAYTIITEKEKSTENG
jgi:hypothetical protein